MSNITRAAWVQLYKDLLRASDKFPQYNYRLFARRRVRDYFEKYRTVAVDQHSKLFVEGRDALTSINRQVSISKSYPQYKIVVEEPSPASV